MKTKILFGLAILLISGCGGASNKHSSLANDSSIDIINSSSLSSDVNFSSINNSSPILSDSTNSLIDSTNSLSSSSELINSTSSQVEVDYDEERTFEFDTILNRFGSDYQSQQVRVNGIEFWFDDTHYEPTIFYPILNVTKNEDSISYVELINDVSLEAITRVEYNILAYRPVELENLGFDAYIGLQYYSDNEREWYPAQNSLTPDNIDDNPHIVNFKASLNIHRVRLAFVLPYFPENNARFILQSMTIKGVGAFIDDPIDESAILPTYFFEDYLADGFIAYGDVVQSSPGVNFKGTGAYLYTPIYDMVASSTRVTLSIKLNGGVEGNVADNNIFTVEGYNSSGEMIEKVDKIGMRQNVFQDIYFDFSNPNIVQYRLIYTNKATSGEYATGGNYQVQSISIIKR